MVQYGIYYKRLHSHFSGKTDKLIKTTKNTRFSVHYLFFTRQNYAFETLTVKKIQIFRKKSDENNNKAEL